MRMEINSDQKYLFICLQFSMIIAEMLGFTGHEILSTVLT